jgi:14-3-3 protein epsilon
MEAVLHGGTWSFDNNMLIVEQVQLGMQIDQIPLHHVNMWVQVHDLPTGLMKERVGIPLANFIGSFVEYDKNNNSSFWRQYMRIRVRIDVRKPLKKDTKVMNKEGKWCIVKFKYEKLGISMEQDDGVREWSAEIRAETRRQGGKITSLWLREDGGGRPEVHGGDRGSQPHNPVGSASAHVGPNEAELANGSSISIHNRAPPNNPTLTTRQTTSIPTKNTQANTLSLFSKNETGNDCLIIPNSVTQTTPITQNNIPVPSFMISNNLPNTFTNPNIHSPKMNNQFPQIILNRPEPNNIKNQSTTHQLLTFNSQSMLITHNHLKTQPTEFNVRPVYPIQVNSP